MLNEEIALNDECVMAFVNRVDAFLLKNGVPNKTTVLVELACEEYLLFTKDRNNGKQVEAECCVRIEPDSVVFSIWDTGEVFDLTDENAVPNSVRAYVVASLMERQAGKKHMVATSFNRNSFSFPITDMNISVCQNAGVTLTTPTAPA
jgi:anti-sigma regulatory factor (Ser/Thr protein kinase)